MVIIMDDQRKLEFSLRTSFDLVTTSNAFCSLLLVVE